MPQLSLYLDDSEMEILREDAKHEGVSLSRYAARLIRENAGRSMWPAGYWDSVYGALDDNTFSVHADELAPELDDSANWFE